MISGKLGAGFLRWMTRRSPGIKQKGYFVFRPLRRAGDGLFSERKLNKIKILFKLE